MGPNRFRASGFWVWVFYGVLDRVLWAHVPTEGCFGFADFGIRTARL